MERWHGVHCFVLLVLSSKGHQRKGGNIHSEALGEPNNYEVKHNLNSLTFIVESDLVNIRTVPLHNVLDLEKFFLFF